MKPYGRKSTGRVTVAGHQRCGVCQPDEPPVKARARREGREDVAPYLGTEQAAVPGRPSPCCLCVEDEECDAPCHTEEIPAAGVDAYLRSSR